MIPGLHIMEWGTVPLLRCLSIHQKSIISRLDLAVCCLMSIIDLLLKCTDLPSSQARHASDFCFTSLIVYKVFGPRQANFLLLLPGVNDSLAIVVVLPLPGLGPLSLSKGCFHLTSPLAYDQITFANYTN